ncbi:Protein CBG17553 [Caenorhabditis briggsae]|uniref:Protein CBG17553 n=1 Tax=Caenorhabditis briggsae TaxID=6238 RepID=A8XR83_CAEBR|nr:Protein CBG17553 [Caenorhabditis briggsae]CAP35180.2 Protein CBG17553 [Caenorhabditis briggsae]
MTGDIQTQPISDALQSKINLFRTTTDLRTFQINTQTDTIFVNLNYLAEISEYFHILRTGSYTEKTSEKVILDDVFTEELVIFLSYACPEGFEFDRTINQQNITALAYFSDRFMVPWVKQEIKKYFKSVYYRIRSNKRKLNYLDFCKRCQKFVYCQNIHHIITNISCANLHFHCSSTILFQLERQSRSSLLLNISRATSLPCQYAFSYCISVAFEAKLYIFLTLSPSIPGLLYIWV